MAENLRTCELQTGWQFKQADVGKWMSVKRVPTNVHIDLIDNEEIEDPYLGYNELKCGWIAEKTWIYRVNLPGVPAKSDIKHVLAFDGLDTFATVKLNDSVILKTWNMFVMHRVDVTNRLEYDSDNIVEIEFKPALLEAKRVKDGIPKHAWVGFNGDMSRLAVRKAQYHWSWDWGPLLMPCGPWRAVRLESYHARVADMRVSYDVESNLERIFGIIKATGEGAAGMTMLFEASLDGREVFKSVALCDNEGCASLDFCINKPKLWFPHGHGDQPLYTLTATVMHGTYELHTLSKQTGFRKCELVQEPDQHGTSFFFRINGLDIFCGGSDWIPGDSFTPRISEGRYRRWLQTLIDGNQAMVRIWGGGIWEEDCFYDLCDELGILVWQDFMFACGNYPAYPDFLSSVQEEAVCQVKRLRHHPCVVVYAGNNEDYQVQEQSGLTYNYSDKDPNSWLTTDFPARYIYEKILPDVVAAHTPEVPYHPGSPWGAGKPTSDPTVGDLHQWNVWHGTQEKYQTFDQLGGRFNSEFGLEAFPHINTIKHFCTDLSQLYPQSRMMDFHNKAAGHERRIATYLVENFRTETELEKYIHLTQLSQSEAMSFAYKGWRRQWGQQRRCGGALVWQLNDCWPTISWSIVDYFLRKKPAYYAIKRALAPIAVAVKRAHHDWSVAQMPPPEMTKWECWVASSKHHRVCATVEVRFVSIASGKDIKASLIKRNIEIEGNGAMELFKGVIDNAHEEEHVLAARIWIDGKVVSRDVDWPQPLKYLDFSEREVDVIQSDGEIKVTAARPTKGLVLEERDGVVLGDSGMDVVPGDEQTIAAQGLESSSAELSWRYLGASQDSRHY
ncbi:glycoside hydrolase family 2 protein [Polychaeton citri CBS 116435]|uniref:Beta-mannosidase B n=1 Tax=Polychaeton citri CBS 116435 TaxID=1314669 RepID=A0A9P4Q324_9PEZI|nr:glycoside hydrolase family 2 protein [Polychaeton citri CBS 116435]